MVRQTICIVIALFLIGCTGDSGNTDNNNPDNQFNVAINDKPTDKIDDINKVGKVNIKLTNTNNTNLEITDVFVDNQLLQASKLNTTCIKNLEPNESCQIEINIDQVYSARTYYNLDIISASQTHVIKLPIVNYDWKPSHLRNLQILVNNKKIEELDFIKAIGNTFVTIKNLNDDAVELTNISLSSTQDTIDKQNTTCKDILNPNESCLISLDIKGLYKTKTNINLNLDTNFGKQKIDLPIWNIGWSPTKLALLHDEVPVREDIDFTALGDTVLKLVNNSEAMVFIDSITFNSPSHFNKLLTDATTCGGILLSGSSCIIHVDYKGIYKWDETTLNKESFIIGYNDTTQEFKYINNTRIDKLELGLKFDCQTLGTCILHFNPNPNYKTVIKSYTPIDFPTNVIMQPNTNQGCENDLDITKLNSCSFNLTTTSYPVDIGYIKAVKVAYRYYVDKEEKYFIDAESLVYGFSIHEVNPIVLEEGNTTYGASCFSKKGRIVDPDVFKAITIRNVANSATNIYIKQIEFTAGTTNYEDYPTKRIITPEEAILNNDCSNATIAPNYKCEIQLQGGCQGYGSEGDIKITYAIDNSSETFIINKHLADVKEGRIELGIGEGEHFQYIWNAGELIKPEYRITIPPAKPAGFLIAFPDWRDSASYTQISDNYLDYMLSGFRVNACLGDMGRDINDNFFTSGKYPFCGIGMDFSTQQAGTSIPFVLHLGSRAQYEIHTVFDIKSSTYVKPQFYGDIK